MNFFINRNILKLLEILLYSGVICSLWIIKTNVNNYLDWNVILAIIVGTIGYSYTTHLLKFLHKIFDEIETGNIK